MRVNTRYINSTRRVLNLNFSEFKDETKLYCCGFAAIGCSNSNSTSQYKSSSVVIYSQKLKMYILYSCGFSAIGKINQQVTVIVHFNVSASVVVYSQNLKMGILYCCGFTAIIRIIDNFCIALFSGVHKPTAQQDVVIVTLNLSLQCICCDVLSEF